MENKIKKIISEEVNKKYPLIEDEVTTTFLLISGILIKSWKGLSITRVRNIMTTLGYQHHQIQSAEKKLKDMGFIISEPHGKYWFNLSEPAIHYFNYFFNNLKDKKNFTNIVMNKLEEINYYPGQEFRLSKQIRLLSQKIGRDMIIYIDPGEKDRLIWAMNHMDEIGRKYRKIYIFHALDVDDKFINEFKEKAKNISLLKPEIIEDEIWKLKNIKKILEVIDNPRKHFDIIFSAMPRLGVILLYKSLNFPNLSCEQDWYYNRARKYQYSSGEISHKEDLEVCEANNTMIFGENFDTRFKYYQEFAQDKDIYVGYSNLSHFEDGYEIDLKTNLMLDKMKFLKNAKKFVVDYKSVYSILQQIKYYKPEEIYISGNRVTALAVAVYFTEKYLNDEKRPHLCIPHVDSQVYSEGYLSELEGVLYIS